MFHSQGHLPSLYTEPESHPSDLQRTAPVTISQLRQLSGQTETNHNEPLEITFWENTN